uniref:cytochrome c-type biogenesis protein n=1 Tax=Thaumasiovibrio occultus TaxID=1891184 RepID=UPI000B359074|nr:cytochrome c-type biogenesis protein [Thaumasiovibrio occultus]
MRNLLFAMTLILSLTLQASSIDAYEFDDPKMERTFHELNKTLRCPKCQNNSIGDSNAELAQDLRQKVYVMLKDGQDEDEIVDFMVARYGNFVTYDPPITAGTLILWLAPLLTISAGIGMMVFRLKRAKRQPTELNSEEQSRLDALLADEEDRG